MLTRDGAINKVCQALTGTLPKRVHLDNQYEYSNMVFGFRSTSWATLSFSPTTAAKDVQLVQCDLLVNSHNEL